MKKISIFAAVLALLTLSLNAQLNTAKKAVVKPKTTTEKKVDMPQDGFKMNLQPEGFRAPKRATVEHTSTLTFTAKCNGAGTADDGVAWTVTSDATESNFDNTRGIHYGTNSARVTYIELSTSGIPTNATITNIAVNASRGGSTAAYLNATVNGNQFGSQQTLTTSAATYNLSGQAASGNIVVRISKTRSTGALYCKSITVTYTTEEGDGGETTDVTVCDGNAYAQYLPLLGYYHDEAQHNQMIYPASMLTSMVGKTIKSMTFYPTTGSVTWSDGTTQSASGINFRNGSVCFKLACITSGTSFDSQNPSFVTATLTEVSTITMPSTADASATTWLITFDQDFVYTGGDLLIDVTNPTLGDWGLTFFTVAATDGYYGYLTSGAGNAALNYLPKVTFTYEGAPDPVHDLGIALSAQPTAVGAGNAITLTATVTNTGNQTEEGYTVTFTAGGTTIATQTASEPLAAGATATFTTTYTPTEAQAGQTVNFGASVACTDDADATNNDATASAQVITLPPPENVAATGAASSGTMTWNAPSTLPMGPTTIAWDFEEEADFTAFTTIDADGDGYNWTWQLNTGTSNMTTHGGDGVVYSESYHNTGTNSGEALTPNNWMISPEVPLGGTLTLWACGQDANYPAEVFGVYVCTGSYNNTTSFVQVEADVTTTGNMTQYTFDLSQYSGQGHFAIVHHNVSDQFILDVDDIEYTYMAEQQPVSYNIYLDGQLVGNVDANTYSYTFTNVEGEHQCAVSAVYALGESAAVPATFTTVPKTATPEITYTSDGDNVVITATGNGTVTLTVNGQTVSGEGAASITVPCGVEATTVTATATAQETGKLISDTQTLTVNIPAGQGWTVMDGEYNNPNDLLSFLKDEEDIMMIDQFIASTLNNDHPAGYTYTLVETVNGEDKVSTPVTVPVYKTNSVMKGFYSYNQIMADTDMHLQAGVVNAEMDYGVHPDRNSLYYSLYRDRKVSDGTMTANTYPAIEIPYRVSQLQKYDEKVGDQVQYFFTETHSTGITPKYDAIGTQTVELLDTNYVQVGAGEKMSYVPVIWTFGLYTARGDGKNNSYGSDIKTEKLGEVGATYEAYYTTGDYGKFKVGNVEYCIYYPEIKVTGTLPAKVVYNDDDEAVYTPFMYRAWCTYPGARNFTLDSNGHLIDAGALITAESPAYLLQTEIDETHTEVTLGGDTWKPGQPKEQWAFGVPVEGVNPSDITFVVRFYYKKTTSEVAPNGLRNQRAEGDDDHAYYIVETRGSVDRIITAVNELYGAGVEPVSVTYVNAQGMQSSKPFDGINIVVTRYSDGSTTTSKIVR